MKNEVLQVLINHHHEQGDTQRCWRWKIKLVVIINETCILTQSSLYSPCTEVPTNQQLRIYLSDNITCWISISISLQTLKKLQDLLSYSGSLVLPSQISTTRYWFWVSRCQSNQGPRANLRGGPGDIQSSARRPSPFLARISRINMKFFCT